MERRGAEMEEFVGGEPSLKDGVSLPILRKKERREFKSFFLNFRLVNWDCMTFSTPTGVNVIDRPSAAWSRRLCPALVLDMIIDIPLLSCFISGSQASPNEMSANSAV